MYINDIRLFLEVAELGSFSKVAAQRSTVQSHISRQISHFETSCGGALFRRTGRGVVLTEFGEHVQQRVRVWLKDSACTQLAHGGHKQHAKARQHEAQHKRRAQIGCCEQRKETG